MIFILEAALLFPESVTLFAGTEAGRPPDDAVVLFDGATCVRPAVITAFLNGVLVQDGWELEGPTGHLRRTQQTKPPSDKGPIKLQQHLCPVRFRNVWVRELPERLNAKEKNEMNRRLAVAVTFW